MVPKFQSPLLCRKAFINGAWISSEDGKQFPVINPANGQTLALVADVGPTETRRAIQAANQALPLWRSLLAKDRAGLLRKWFELILSHREDLALLMTHEQGKPLAESRSEVTYGAAFVEWFAEETKRVYGDIIPSPWSGHRLFTLKQPIGVVAAITPWNFPIAMITRKCAPALAAGCTVVLKPAEETPLCALALAKLAQEAGFPKGVLNILPTSDPVIVGQELTQNPLVQKLSFTGSTQVGKILMQQSASTIKKISLELGGNAPFLVFDDADLDQAIAGAIASKYRNTGQTCVCANRFLIQEGIYSLFAKKLALAVSQLQVGPGWEENVQQGPLINQRAVQKVEQHIEDAKEKGAHVLLGGRRHSLGGTFFEPTILTDVTPGMILAQEETFGPVAPLFRFKTEQEAILLANNTEFGLAAYVYTKDVARMIRVAEALEYGMVGINEGIISTEVAPFGGVKQSGMGREGSKYGIEDYLEIKYLCLGGI